MQVEERGAGGETAASKSPVLTNEATPAHSQSTQSLSPSSPKEPSEPGAAKQSEVIKVVEEKKHHVRPKGLTSYLGSAVIDFCFFILFVVIIVCWVKFAPPFKRSLACNDPTLSYPFKPSKVTVPTLVGFLVAIVVLPVLSVEAFQTARYGMEKKLPCLQGFKIYLFFVFKYIGSNLFGLMLNVTACLVSKFKVGRMRPHFYDVCRVNCDWDFAKPNYECAPSSGNVTYLFLSFYSLHASLAMHTATFVVLYLQARFSFRYGGRWILGLLQSMLIVLAQLIGYSRVLDNNSHLTDVLVGFLAGTITGAFSAISIARVFQHRTISKADVKRIKKTRTFFSNDFAFMKPLTQQTSVSPTGVVGDQQQKENQVKQGELKDGELKVREVNEEKPTQEDQKEGEQKEEPGQGEQLPDGPEEFDEATLFQDTLLESRLERRSAHPAKKRTLRPGLPVLPVVPGR